MDRRVDNEALVEAMRGCPALRHALKLADWVGDGRPVTGKGVLRPVNARVACCVLGAKPPPHVQSAANLPILHVPWTTAIVLGLLSTDHGRAVPGPALAAWRSASDDEVIDGWLRGLAGVLAVTFDVDAAGALEVGRLALTVLAAEPALTGADLVYAIWHKAASTSSAAALTVDHSAVLRHPAEVALDVLAAFGAVDGPQVRRQITPLGHFALSMMTAATTPVGALAGVFVA